MHYQLLDYQEIAVDKMIRYSKPYKDGKEWSVDLFEMPDNVYLETIEFKSQELALIHIKQKLMENPEENKVDSAKQEARDSIKDLLDQAEASSLPVETASDSDLPARIDLPQMDYLEVKSNSAKKGKKLMNSLLKLYLSADVIENNEYIKMKAHVDEMTLASLMFQMQTAEHALTTLLRTIDSGELHPRMFEVLGGLQKTMLDIMKHQTLHLHAMEEGAKKLKHDIDIYSPSEAIETGDAPAKSTDGHINRGNRNMMQQIQADIQDVDFDPDEDK